MARHCIGIDLGGTYVKFCLLDGDRQPGELLELRTPDEGDDLIHQMVQGSRELMDRSGVSDAEVLAVGIGSPGPLDFETGCVISLSNLPGLDGLPIRDRVSEGLGLPAVLENDANTAAYGEYICGHAGGTGDMVMLTLGTGVGSGIIIDGKILHGAHGLGGEIGHMIVEPDGELCGCGQRGCLERYCSATYIAERAMRRIEAENSAGPLGGVFRQKGTIDAKDIQEAAAAGDELASDVWDRAAYYLAIGCASICRIFDPDRIVLGGGMSRAGDQLMRPLLAHFRKLHWSLTDVRTEIELARLGNDAGAIGAAGVAWSEFG